MAYIEKNMEVHNFKILKSKLEVVQALRILNYTITDGKEVFENLKRLEGSSFTIGSKEGEILFNHLYDANCISFEVKNTEEPERNFPPLCSQDTWDMALDGYAAYMKKVRQHIDYATPDNFVEFLMKNYNLCEKLNKS